MLKRRAAAFALALCMALISPLIQSQGLSQQPGEKQPESAVSQPKGAEEQRGTPQPPLVIQVVPSQKTDEERAEEAQERERIAQADRNKEKTDADIVKYTEQLALFTKGLFFATVALFIATVGLLVAGERQLRLANNEFLSTHRPALRIKHVWLMTNLWHDRPIAIRIIYVNNGTAEATMTDYGIRLIVLKAGRLLPADIEITPVGIQGRLLSGQSLKLPDTPHGLSDEEESAIRNGKANLYCVGFLHYQDGAKRLRTTSFCRVLKLADHPRQDTGRFSVVSGADADFEYEYQD
jgi:hypothetical protein